MAHLLAWQSVALEAARELAVDDASATIERADADWEARGGEVINAELTAAWAARPMDELREAFATVPGELRGYADRRARDALAQARRSPGLVPRRDHRPLRGARRGPAGDPGGGGR